VGQESAEPNLWTSSGLSAERQLRARLFPTSRCWECPSDSPPQGTRQGPPGWCRRFVLTQLAENARNVGVPTDRADTEVTGVGGCHLTHQEGWRLCGTPRSVRRRLRRINPPVDPALPRQQPRVNQLPPDASLDHDQPARDPPREDGRPPFEGTAGRRGGVYPGRAQSRGFRGNGGHFPAPGRGFALVTVHK
jgi:hypothetical protein